MRILHVIPSVSKKRGGPSTAIISMVRELRKQGIDAAILTTSDNDSYRESDVLLGRWFFVEDVPILMFPAIETNSRVLNEYLISPALSCWLIKNIDKYDALHIHSIFSYCSTTSMLIARLKKTPYFVRTIGQLNTWSLTQSRLRKFMMLLLVERGNLMKAAAIHVTSQFEEDELRNVCSNKKILCLELGINIPEREQLLASPINGTIRFVFLSRIHPKKQLDKLLEALSFLYNEYNEKSWKLYIAGDGDNEYLSYLKQYANDQGIGNNVEWMGHLDEEQKFKLLQMCDWYVLPSKSENFGLSVLESLAIGLPVIISKEVGISSIVLQYKAGYIVGDQVSLKNALRVALKGSPIEMKIAAVKLATERFSWREIIKKLIFFYDRQIFSRVKE